MFEKENQIIKNKNCSAFEEKVYKCQSILPW